MCTDTKLETESKKMTEKLQKKFSPETWRLAIVSDQNLESTVRLILLVLSVSTKHGRCSLSIEEIVIKTGQYSENQRGIMLYYMVVSAKKG